MRTLEFTAENGEKIKIFHPEDILAIKKPSAAISPQRGINAIIYFRNTDNMMCVREDYTRVSSNVTKILHKIEQDMDGQVPTVNML